MKKHYNRRPNGGYKMKKIIGVIIILFCSTPILAQKVTIDVPGAVCQMCVQGMKKAFKDAVQNEERDIIVNLDTKKVILNLVTNLTNVEISKRIKDAGYNAQSIHRE